MRPRSAGWLALPAWIWFALFLLAPTAIVGVHSLGTRGTYGGVRFGVDFTSYLRVLDPLYLRILGNSLWLAASTSVSCLLLGYPMAYAMATARGARRSWLLTLILLPFWTNFVIRAYAIKVWLPPSELAVWVGMVTSYLPFMVLPIYVSLEKFDFALLDAARDLGAPAWRIVKEVLVPGTRAGIVTGLVFVFAPALGEFVIPDLLGGARVMLIGNLITEQFLKARDWPFGSALSIALIGAVLATLGSYHAARSR